MKTIDDIRHANLKIAADRVGSATMLAEKAGVSAGYLSRLKNHAIETRTGNVKAMGTKVARKLEAAIGEPAGWFDADQTPEAASLRQAVNDNAISPDEVATLFQAYFEASPAARKRIPDLACREASAAKYPVPSWVRSIFSIK